jgi:hypothetical protein
MIGPQENNEPLQSGTSRKRLKLRDEGGRLRICRKRHAPRLEKKERRLHERSEADQDNLRLCWRDVHFVAGERSASPNGLVLGVKAT